MLHANRSEWPLLLLSLLSDLCFELQAIEDMLDEVDILKDSSEPQWDFDSLDARIAESDANECVEKLKDAKKDLLKLKADEEKKSQVQKEFLSKIGEVDELNKENVEKFTLIRGTESEPEKIKAQVVAVKASILISL